MIIYFHLCVIFNFWRYALASTAGKQEYAAYIVDPCRSLVGRCTLNYIPYTLYSIPYTLNPKPATIQT